MHYSVLISKYLSWAFGVLFLELSSRSRKVLKARPSGPTLDKFTQTKDLRTTAKARYQNWNMANATELIFSSTNA